MNIVGMTMEHVAAMQQDHRRIGKYVQVEDFKLLLQYPAFAGISNDKVVGAAGMYDLGSGRWGLWALFGSDAGEHMLAVHRAARRFLDIQDHRRIEATVECDFKNGHRWIRMLGFTCEAKRMKNYDPDGRDHALYARIT